LINGSISKKLKGTGHSDVEKICPKCHNLFKVRWNKRNQQFCSRSCSAKSLSIESKESISKNMLGKNSGEKNGMFGKTPSNTKRILVFSNKEKDKNEFFVKSSYEKIYVDLLNRDPLILFFQYEPKEFKVFYKDSNNKRRTYQPDFLINGKEIVEIKNTWNAKLPETLEKEKAFKNQYPNMLFKIIKW
jgi:hypothetical protein